ncbi:MAG: hypothetical protein KDB35_22785, partial [Acidimicrobiales bacterium]|nr:hypothetical protein [Acidimicrobiales bacterium]
SRELTFYCWDRIKLLDISNVFANEYLAAHPENDPLEVVGAPSLESGWIRINGAAASSSAITIPDPAFYAVLVECVNGNRCGADLPFELCDQDNGDLLPRHVLGDQ